MQGQDRIAADATLGSSAFFFELPTDLREQLRASMLRHYLAPSEVLVLEGEPCPGLCVVESGLVKIYKISPGGREQVLFLAGPGESFADAAAFTGETMPASVEAIDASSVLILPEPILNHLLDTDSRFARAVIRHLSQQLQHVVHLVEDLSFRNVQSRVAKVLLQSLNPQAGIGAGLRRRPMTQRDIAEMVGTVREVVTRTLGDFAERGLIRIERGQIELLDDVGLQALV